MEFLDFIKKRTLLTASLVLLGVVTSTTTAEYIQFTFTGEVTGIVGTPWDPWQGTQLGDTVKVQYIFDSNAEDQWDGPDDIGRYSFLDLVFSIGDTSFGTTEGLIHIRIDDPIFDSYGLGFSLDNGTNGSIYFLGDLFTSDELPTDVYWTQFFIQHSGFIQLGSESDPRILYQFNNFEAIVIPAAPSFLILLLGASYRRRRK